MCRSRTWSLHVANDRTGLVIHELDAHLGNTSTRSYFHSSVSHFRRICILAEVRRTSASKDLNDLHQLDGLLGRGIHICGIFEG